MADLRPIIEEIADQADDFLAEASDRAHAKAGISELLTMDYPQLNPTDRATVVTGVMKILEEEDFLAPSSSEIPFPTTPTKTKPDVARARPPAGLAPA